MNVKRIVTAIAVALSAGLVITGCASSSSTTVQSKQYCKDSHGHLQYCLTYSNGRVVYVPRAVYARAQAGDDVEGTSEHPVYHAPEPEVHVNDPVEVHPVVDAP